MNENSRGDLRRASVNGQWLLKKESSQWMQKRSRFYFGVESWGFALVSNKARFQLLCLKKRKEFLIYTPGYLSSFVILTDKTTNFQMISNSHVHTCACTHTYTHQKLFYNFSWSNLCTMFKCVYSDIWLI